MIKLHHLKSVKFILLSCLMLLAYQNCGKVVFQSDELEKTNDGSLGIGPPVVVTPIEPIGDDPGDDDDPDEDDPIDPGPPNNNIVDAYCKYASERQFLGKNFLRNSGFERRDGRIDLRNDIPLNNLENHGGWGFYESLPGGKKSLLLDTWYAEGSAPLEVQASGKVIKAYRGNRLVELDSNANVSMVQDVIICEDGNEQILSFAYAPRGAEETSGVRVSIGDYEVAEIYGKHEMQWDVYRYKISNLPRGIHRVRFEGIGTSDSYGALIDRVRLKQKVAAKKGVVSILLALGDTKDGKLVIEPSYAKKLIRNAVKFASRMEKPRILLIRDSNSRNESPEDINTIYDFLSDGHFDNVDLIDEGPEGVSMDMLAGYDLVWLNNPGYAMGSQNTLLSLLAFEGGVVLSGDDMSQGEGFDTSLLTGLKYKTNGTTVACGDQAHLINDNTGGSYSIKLGRFFKKDSALEDSVEGYHFLYGNDIDHTEILNPKMKVMARATVSKPGCEDFSIPVMMGYRK